MTTYAWGFNHLGFLGLGNLNIEATVTVPTAIADFDFAEAISDGATTLFRTSDGKVYFAGDNGYGASGTGSSDSAAHYSPGLVSLSSIVRLGIGTGIAGSQDYYALDSSGALWAWGLNQYGEFGQGNTLQHFVPIVIANNVAAFAGGQATIILLNDGRVQTAGWNAWGQLADGTTTDRTSWTTVTPSSGAVTGVAYGGDGFSLLCMADGSVLGAGYDGNGELAFIEPSFAVPHPNWLTVAFPAGVTEVWTGTASSYARVGGTPGVGGTIYAVGYDFNGQLGDGRTFNPPSAYATAAPLYTGNIPVGVSLNQCTKAPLLNAMGAVGSDGLVYTWGRSLTGSTFFDSDRPATRSNGLTGITWVGGGSAMWAGTLISAPVVRRGRSFGQVIGG